MEIGLLGPLVVRSGGTVIAIAGARQRALLARLALVAGQVVSADLLVEALWGGEDTRGSRHALQVHVSTLRKALGEAGQVIRTHEPGYVLDAAHVDLDVTSFERHLATARAALGANAAATALERIESALKLWRGPPYAEFAYTDWAAAEIARLEQVRDEAVELRIDAKLALGGHQQLIAELEALVRAQPHRERLRAQLMLALYRCGRQADALAAYRDAREALVETLGIEPGPELQDLQRAILRQDESLRPEEADVRVVEAIRAPLPVPPEPLVGRQQEISDVAELLRAGGSRLVTLIGPGGVGKTRLAIAVAAQVASAFPAAAFVDLAPIEDASLVLPAIAQALGVRDDAGSSLEAAIVTSLSDRPTLLLLDNLEHVLEAAPAIANVLAHTGVTVMLATSRTPLRITGEQEFDVSPLAPDDARELFLARANRIRTAFATTAEAVVIDEICTRLDRLPLAIELAAARTRALSPAALLTRLASRLAVLTGGPRDRPNRQQTIRATLDWSYELLSEREQQLFARVAVFAGDFALDAAERVADADLDTLQALVEQSLVAPSGERFSMLETIRAYALERLTERGEAELMQARHADHVAGLLDTLEPLFRGRDEQRAFNVLHAEQDNIRAALRFLLDRQHTQLALRLLGDGLPRYWRIQGQLSEGRRWLEEALALTGAGELPRAHVLRHLANIAGEQGDHDLLVAAANEALATFRRHECVGPTIDCLNALGSSRLMRGDHRPARPFFEESERLARAAGDTYRLAAATASLASIELQDGSYDRALELHEHSVAIARELGRHEMLAACLVDAGTASLQVGSNEQAAEYYREGLAVAKDIGSPARVIVHATAGLGSALVTAGDESRAVQLLAGALALAESINLEVDAFESHMYERALQHARARLGHQAFDAARASGRALSREALAASGLATPRERPGKA